VFPVCIPCTMNVPPSLNPGAVAGSLPAIRHEPVPGHVSPHDKQQLRVAGGELYWGQRAVHLDWCGPEAVLGVRYVGIVKYSWQRWAMPYRSAIPQQPLEGQVLKVTEAKTRASSTSVRLDAGGGAADNTFYLVEIYACYLSSSHATVARG